MSDDFSLIHAIKTPRSVPWPANERTRAQQELNLMELSIKRNLMTGLPEALVDKYGGYYPVPFFFKLPKQKKEGGGYKYHHPEQEKISAYNPTWDDKPAAHIQNHYYKIVYQGYLAPRNEHGAPLLRHEPHHLGMPIPHPYRDYWLSLSPYSIFHRINIPTFEPNTAQRPELDAPGTSHYPRPR